MTSKVLNTKEQLNNSNIAFGTSGARGLVKNFTPEVCAAFTIAFIEVMKQDFSFDTIAVGIDNRPSSTQIALDCLNAIESQGIEAINYGVLPTPALAYTCIEKKIPSIMITGSHIPFDRNGIKFYRPDGEISKLDEAKINQVNKSFSLRSNDKKYSVDQFAVDNYIGRYTQLLKPDSLKGKRIGIYEHSSAGRDIYYKIFQHFGAEVIALERTEHFVPIDTEAVSHEDQQKALTWSQDHNFDMIFSTDGDGDRPLIADENGHWLRGDILGLIVSAHLNIEALAVPVSCNTAIEVSNLFKKCKRTKIGSPYVIAEFQYLQENFNSVAGFEANGGFLLGSDTEFAGNLIKALPTRDAVLPAIVLLNALLKQPISNFIQDLPQRFTASDRIKNMSTEASKQLIAKYLSSPRQLPKDLGVIDCEILQVDQTDGLRVTLSNSDIIHLRPSGNAPELRCYIESSSEASAQKLVKLTIERIINLSL